MGCWAQVEITDAAKSITEEAKGKPYGDFFA